MSAYYNEFDSYAAAWLRNLIAAGHIPRGDVDERSIVDVKPTDLTGYTQAHFFAGIGGWPLALKSAGWDADRPVWTGSCPCQPFSAAGQRKGTADARHLWPEFERLIAELLPPTVFGEQVASKDGRVWLTGIRTDLEGMGYAVGAVDLCAASVGAPHIRQRLFWVAEAENAHGWRGEQAAQAGIGQDGERGRGLGECGLDGGLADADGGLAGNGGLQPGRQHGFQPQDGGACGVEYAASDGREQRRAEPSGRGIASGCGEGGGVGDSNGVNRPQEQPGIDALGGQWPEKRRRAVEQPRAGATSGDGGGLDTVGVAGTGDGKNQGRLGNNFWSAADWLPCTDGKARRVESGTFPLAHGASNRVGRLRAYGNAIVPQVAAQFIKAWSD